MACFPICALLLSCASNSNIVSDIKYVHWGGSERMVYDTTLFSKCREVCLETVEGGLIGSVDKIVEADNNLYILDRRNNLVFIFNSEGKYVKTINRKGRGRGEYLRLFDMCFDTDSKRILLLAEPSEILFFDKYGNYIQQKRVDKYYTDIATDSLYIYLYNSTFSNYKEPQYTVEALKKGSRNSVKILPFEKEYAPFCTIGSKLYSSYGKIMFTRKFDNVIYEVKNGDLTTGHELDLAEFSFPTNKLDKTYDCRDLTLLCAKNRWVYCFNKIINSNETMLFSSNLDGVFVYLIQPKICKYYDFIRTTYFGIPIDKKSFLPIEGKSGELCFVDTPEDFIRLAEIANEDSSISSKANGRFYQKLKRVKEGDNPTLLIYTIK